MSDEIKLNDGSKVLDARLGRLVQFDEKSRQYPIRTLIVKAARPRSYTWRCPVWLDQGYEGACVGFSLNHELAARPTVVSGTSYKSSMWVYREAQKIDPWEGEDYDGTSVLAGVKVLTDSGYFKEYRWAFGLDDLIFAVGHKGPAVIGCNWYTGMFDTDEKGFIHATGYLAGGHAILCNGVNIKGQYFTLHNSWGKDWGVNGECKISFDDMNKLLHEDGEACVPVVRSTKRTFAES